jgi:hypothetical protein
MKGTGAKVPCRECRIIGVYHQAMRTYYVPLTEPAYLYDPPTNTPETYNPLHLPLHTENGMIHQHDRIESAPTMAEPNDLAKKYGIPGQSILDKSPLIQRPTSHPHKFMHLFLLNHGPQLVSHWTGTFPGISDEGFDSYFISAEDWVAIGNKTEAVSYLIPAIFIRPIPNIQTS